MKNQIWRQGDILLQRVDSIPANCEKYTKVNGEIVLALGESTGHKHVINCKKAKGWLSGSDFYIELEKNAELKHQEHSTIPLPTGFYKKIQQREYSPEAIRNVAD